MRVFMILTVIFLGMFPAAILHAEDIEDMISNTAPAMDPAVAEMVKTAGGGMSMAAIMWAMVFGAIGSAFLWYAIKKKKFVLGVISFALVGYPYVVQDAKLIAIIGIVLTFLLWKFRKS